MCKISEKKLKNSLHENLVKDVSTWRRMDKDEFSASPQPRDLKNFTSKEKTKKKQRKEKALSFGMRIN